MMKEVDIFIYYSVNLILFILKWQVLIGSIGLEISVFLDSR